VLVCGWAFDVGLWLIAVWLVAVVVVFVAWNSGRNLFIGAMVLCILVVASFGITHAVYDNTRAFHGEGELVGVVRSLRMDDEGNGNMVLASARFDGERVRGSIRVTFRELDDDLALGDVVSARVILNQAEASSFSVNNRLRYTANLGRGDIHHVRDSRDVRSVILRHANAFLHNFMSEDSANLLYSMMFGDRSSLDDEMQDNLRLSGLAHVLAVSGLHVGLLVGLMMLVMKGLRLGKRMQFGVLVAVLLFYLYLSDFRVSMMRACIMFATFAFCGLFARRVDLVQRICLAWVVILVLFPYQMFSFSFQLSFACLFGIALFHRPMSRFYSKCLPGKWLPQALAMCTATAVVTWVLIIGIFGFWPPFGILMNLLMLPLIALAFQLAFIALLTYGVPLLWVADALIRGVLWLTERVARLPQVYITTYGAWHLFYFAGLVMLSRFILIRNKKTRACLAGLMFAIFAGALLVMNT